uniref:Innexin n=1 Tax=Amblyomma aureolatum TaxID=187763 RepID=A0A1E1XAB3_9ACAR
MFYMLVAPLHRAIKINRIVLDNQIFRLHYKATSLLMLMFSILVTSTQYFGDPIDCIQHDAVPPNVIRTFCWIHSTFNIPSAYNATVGVDGVPYPGIERYTPDEVRRYYGYYQWVCMVLFLQAGCFYLPRYLWKSYEQGLIRSLVQDLDCPIKEDADVCQKTESIARYVRSHLNMHGRYFGWYVSAEVLNFVNVVGQILLTDAFLGNMFTTLGTDVLSHHNEDPDVRNDPMVWVFPRVTKCSFHLFGTSGDVQKHDALCLLAQNIINEKIYIFLWFWWVILAALTSVELVYRMATIFLPKVREVILRYRARMADRRMLEMVSKRVSASDWFLLDLLCKNMNPVHYRTFINELAKSMEDEYGKRLLGGVDTSNTSTV